MVGMLLASGSGWAQQTPPSPYTNTSFTNAVREWQARKPLVNESDIISGSQTTREVLQTTKYSDGFGRPVQSVTKQVSPLGVDVVAPSVYDSYGREQFKYLPFASNAASSGDVTNDGNFKTDPFQQQVAFYNSYLNGQPGETGSGAQSPNWAYSQNVFEASPLNRVTSAYAPGVHWVGSQGSGTPHSGQQLYLVNTAMDSVQMWNINAAQGSIPTSGGAYPAGKLYKSVSTDEQGNQVIEYKDMYGQTVLKKVQNTAAADNGTGSGHPGWLCTYSVYDDYGNLRFVIPPAVVQQIDGTWSISQTVADELCYRYEYDLLDRMVIKRKPGTASGSAGEMWMVYDVRNRLVMMQDGNMRSTTPQPQWLCSLYDVLDRQTMTGTISSTNTLSQMQSSVTAQTGSNSSGTVSGTAPPAIQGNLTLSQPSMTGTWQAAQSITLDPGFSSTGTTTFTAQIVAQATAPLTNTVVVNNNPLPSGVTLTPLTAVFYDNYNWMSTSGAPLSALLNQTNTQNGSYFTTSYNSSPNYAVPMVQSLQTQGQVTGGMAQNLDGSGTDLYTLNIYDDHARLIQMQSINVTGGEDVMTYQYSWSGQILNTLLSHSKSGTNPQTHLVATAMNYDPTGRLLTVTKTVNSTVGGVAINTPVTTVVTDQYNELGQLHQVTLGNNMETEQYDYNVRGWPLGMNRVFAETAGAGANYFGYDLGYDNGSIAATGTSIGSYATPVFNGNVAGTVWKSRGDNQIRKYDFSYDIPGRLLQGANFNQLDGTLFDRNAGIDYSVSGMSYDANGNIGGMNQNGWIAGGSQQIDQLLYHYLNTNSSNRLQYVEDKSAYNTSNPSSMLGDLHYAGTKGTTTSDYGYDANGNVTSDANRSVSSISYYNILNLPKLITFANNKGSILFIYDAAGNKLRKITTENTGSVTYNGTHYSSSIVTTTTYVNGFVYKTLTYGTNALASLQYTDKLQFMGQEAGRVRALYNNAASPATQTGYAFDYFIRDHLNNVRMVLTDEQWQDTYPAATVEPNTITTEQSYYSITNDAAHVIDMATNSSTAAWWPAVKSNNYPDSNASVSNPGDPTPGAASTQMYKLNGQTGDRYGLGITLKVMAGDKVSILGRSVWHNSGTAPGSFQVSSVINSFLSSFAGTSVVAAETHGAVTGSTLYNAGGTAGPLGSLLNSTPPQPDSTVAPKAGINWILFNDQFVPVSMGTDLVSSIGDSVKSHSDLRLPMAANGYLYVYCSNESDLDVFFDNLQVVQTRGPVLEEDHYYPVGLLMAGISDRAWNKLPNFYHYQGKELQDQEFSDSTGLAEHDFGSRLYDQQLGVWHNQDPAGQYASPYMAMGDSWPNGIDPDGKDFWSTLEDIGVFFAMGGVGYIGASLESTGNVLSDVSKWNSSWWKGAITADIVAASVFVGGEAVFAPAGTLAAQLGAGGASVALGAAEGVGEQIGSTLASNFLSNKPLFNWDQMFAASVSGALLGAWKGLNPTQSIDANGNLVEPKSGGMLGLRAPDVIGGVGHDEGLGSALFNRTLYNAVSALGGSIASDWINGDPLFSKFNVPIGPTPFELTFGKGQVLFNWTTNLSGFLQAGKEGLGLLDNLYPNAYYNFNWYTLSSGAGGDNVFLHVLNFMLNQIDMFTSTYRTGQSLP